MTLPRLWAFLAVALPTLAALIAGLPSVDLAYHLRAGAEILASGSIPVADSWTFTAFGLPWTDQQWGAQVVLAAIFQVAGWTGLVLFRAVLVAAIFGCLLEIGRRRGLGMRRAAWLSLAAFIVASPTLGMRPQLLGMALLAMVLLLVVDRRAHPGRLWIVPVIVAVWANIHGSFLLGPLVVGLAWLEDLHDRTERPHRTLLIAVVSAIAACLTPFGPWVWAYAVGLSTNPEVTGRIVEWRPTSLRDAPGLLFFGSAFAVVAVIARRGRSVPWPTLAWLAAFFFIGAYAIRGLAWWPLGVVAGIAGVLIVGSAGDPDRPEPAGTPLLRRLNLVIATALVVAGVALLPSWRPVDPDLQAPDGLVGFAPPGITGALRDLARPGDRLFNPQEWGSWFEFAIPSLPVALDSRIELFPAKVWDDYDAVARGADGWARQLEAWGVSVVVVSVRDAAMAERLSAAGWRLAYADEEGSIFVNHGRS